jgi:hypothetical protein
MAHRGRHGSQSRWQAAGWVARRELMEFVRDRRTLVITLLLPMISYPILALATTLGLRTGVMEAEARLAPTTPAAVKTGPLKRYSRTSLGHWPRKRSTAVPPTCGSTLSAA